MRTRLCLLGVLLLVSATACGLGERMAVERICTARGCQSEVRVRLADLGLGRRAGVVTATMCFDGACSEQRQRFKASGASSGIQGSRLSIEAFDDHIELALRLPPRAYDEETEHPVTLTVSVDGAKPTKVARDVTLERSQPNGPDCEPICWQATIEA